MKDKRVLVTGGSGFIGSHLVKSLLEQGAKVAVTVRYGNMVKNIRLADCWNCITVIEADLRNRGALKAIQRFDPEVVFHLAAYQHVGESFGQVEECFDVNAKGTANLFDVCENVPKFVYIATSEVYGLQETVPFVETMEPSPLSPYAITKYAGEMYCRMKQRMGAPRPSLSCGRLTRSALIRAPRRLFRNSSSSACAASRSLPLPASRPANSISSRI